MKYKIGHCGAGTVREGVIDILVKQKGYLLG